VAAHVGTPTPKAQIQKETQSKPRLSLADMPPAASSTAAIKLIRDFKSRPLIQTIFPSFCGALDIGHGSRPRSPIAAAFTIVAGLIAVNHPTLTTFDIGLFAWEGEVQLRFAQHAPWWLVPGAFGGNLFASTAYVARIAVYTLIFGLIAMGNTQGVGIGAQVASLAMAGAYGTALVLTHRPPVSLFASFYYVAIAVAAVANASFFYLPRRRSAALPYPKAFTGSKSEPWNWRYQKRHDRSGICVCQIVVDVCIFAPSISPRAGCTRLLTTHKHSPTDLV